MIVLNILVTVSIYYKYYNYTSIAPPVIKIYTEKNYEDFIFTVSSHCNIYTI